MKKLTPEQREAIFTVTRLKGAAVSKQNAKERFETITKQGVKECSHCKQVLEISNFPILKRLGRIYYVPLCKRCDVTKNAARRENHKQEYLRLKEAENLRLSKVLPSEVLLTQILADVSKININL